MTCIFFFAVSMDCENKHSVLQDFIREIKANGNTALYDALSEAADKLKDFVATYPDCHKL